MRPVVELSNVSKIYRQREIPVHALTNVSLKIKKKDSIVIMGPSGSGKSTLLHMIGCLDRPTSGKIYVNGKDVSKLDDNEIARIRRKTIGFIFQFFNLIPNFTALRNVELPMIFSAFPNREERAKKLLELVGLGKRMHHYPSQLSGGETQRVAIARAMANDPDIILADEPTGNLDSKSGKEVLDVLKELNKKRGLTLIIVTHDRNIASYCKKKIYLKDGQIFKGGKR